MSRFQDLKTIKEIAAEIGRSRTFVHGAKKAMEEAGIPWTMGMISTGAFVQWIKVNRYKCTNYARRVSD